VSATPRIIILMADGRDSSHVTSWFGKFNRSGLACDIIGLGF
jgi:hypothetical protein